MRRFIARILITIMVLLAGAGAFIATLPLWVDMEQVKGLAAAAVHDATGKELVLDGRLSFSLFPWLGVEARDVSVKDPASGTLLAHSGRILIRIRLLGLLRRQMEADTVTLEGLSLSLVRFADGTTNWDLPAAGEGPSAGAPSLLSYTLAGIRIEDATVTLDDRMTGREVTVRDAMLTTGVIAPSTPIAVRLSGTASGIPMTEAAELDLTARGYFGASQRRVDVEALQVVLHQTDPQGAPAVLRAEARGELSWNPGDGQVRAQRQTVTVKGRAPALGWHRIDARLDLGAAAFTPGATATMEALEVRGAGAFGSPPVSTRFRLWGDVTATPATSQLTLQGGGVELEGLTAESLRVADGALSLEGDLELDGAQEQARLILRSATGRLDSRGPTAATAFTIGAGTLKMNLHNGEAVLDVPAINVTATAPGLGLKRVEAVLGGPIHGGHGTLRVPRVQADAVFAATPETPTAIDGTLALRGPLRLEGRQLHLPALVSSFDLLETTRKLKATGNLSADVDIGLDGPRATLAGLSAEATIDAPTLPAAVTIALTGGGHADMAARTVAAEGLALQALGMKARLAVRGSHILADATWSGALVTDPFNPREVLPALGLSLPPLADPTALKSLSIQGAFSTTPASAGIDTLDVRLDDSRIQGTLNVTYGDPARAAFALDIDALDVDRYMPRPGGQDAEAASAVEAGAALVPMLPRDLTVSGRLAAGELRFQRLRTTGVEAGLELAGGVLRIAPLTARMYGGEVTQRILLDTSGRIPRAGFAMDARAIDVGRLLADLQGRARVTGTGAVAVELESTGVDEVEMTASLDGRGRFDLRDGAVKGINIARLLRQAEAAVSGKALATDGSLQTDFSALTGTFTITNGRLHNDDLDGKSPLLRVKGRGSANLVTRRLDYQLDTSLVATAEGQGGRELGELRDVTIPITFAGTFAEPTYSLDPGRLLAEKAKQAVRRKLEERLERKAADKLEDQLKNRLLEGLFGR